MEDYIIPIEIIEVICKHDLGNWAQLIRVCKRVNRALIGLRWEVKTALRNSSINNVYFVNNLLGITVSNGDDVRSITFYDKGDHWALASIRHCTGRIWHGENIHFNNGKITGLEWYYSNERVGEHSRHENIYYGRNAGYNIYTITKAQMKTRLDMFGIKYIWLKYLPDKK